MKAPFSFIADEKNALIDAYAMKGLFGTSRVSLVIGKDRKVLALQEGLSAINPNETVHACSLHPPEALKYVTAPRATDAGTTAPAPPDAGTKPPAGGNDGGP